MSLLVKTETTDVRYKAIYKEPQIELAGEQKRFPLIREITKRFLLHLNDLRFNSNATSNDYIHFSRFYGTSFLEVSFGLEEIEVWFRRVEHEKQLYEIVANLSEIIKEIPASIQRMATHQHFSCDGIIADFLQSLNPHNPAGFEKLLRRKGIFYTLGAEDHGLTIQVMVAESLSIAGGLYLNVENEFVPNKYNIQDAFAIAREHYYLVLKGLDLQLKEA